jgi:hypothetical protein
MTLGKNETLHMCFKTDLHFISFYAECHYAEFRYVNVVVLSVVVLNVAMMSVVMLSVVVPASGSPLTNGRKPKSCLG